VRLVALVAVLLVLVVGMAACGDTASDLGTGIPTETIPIMMDSPPTTSDVTVSMELTDPRPPTSADVAHWVATWCDLKVGMFPADALLAMGDARPSLVGGRPAGFYWKGGGYVFTAVVAGSTVTQLRVDASPPGGLAALSCPAIRP
jgi:hypothetical protein